MMPTLSILRTSKSTDGIFGVMFDNSMVEFAICCQTDEPYLPDGDYLCRKRFYNHGGYMTFEIEWLNSGHTAILFHRGNTKADSKLCILVAEAFEYIDGVRGVAQSQHGFNEFMSKYGEYEEFTLRIKTFGGF